MSIGYDMAGNILQNLKSIEYIYLFWRENFFLCTIWLFFYIKLNRQITLWCATLILTDLYMMWIKQPIKKVRKESEYEK